MASYVLAFAEVSGFWPAIALTISFTSIIETDVGFTTVFGFFRVPYSAFTREDFLLFATLFLFTFILIFDPKSFR